MWWGQPVPVPASTGSDWTKYCNTLVSLQALVDHALKRYSSWAVQAASSTSPAVHVSLGIVAHQLSLHFLQASNIVQGDVQLLGRDSSAQYDLQW